MIDDILARLRNDETLRNYEARLRHKDGSLRHVLISSSVLWRDRQFVHARCLTIDVTERKLAEDVRQLIERNLSSQYAVTKVLAEDLTLEEATGRLLQGVGEVGNWSVGALWTVDEAGKALRCLSVWRAADANLEEFAAITREMTFAPSVGLPGRVWSTATPAWIEDVVNDPNFPRAAHAERAGLHGALGFPVRIRDRVTGVLEFLSRDVRQPDHNLLQLFDAIGTQIGQFMDRRQSDELHVRMAAIVDSSDDAIISKTLDGVITSWNRGAEDIFGYTANEAVGQNISLIIPADRIGQEHDVLTRLRRGEKIEHFETERQAKDGRRLSISLTVSPVRNADGKIVGASKVARDITDRKQAEEVLRLSKQRAEEAVTARDEFLSIAAHELRNPLNALQLQLVGLQRAAQDYQDSLPKAWVCDRISQATDDVRRLVRLMHNLLDVSRITAGRIDLEPEDLDFSPIVHSVVGRFVAQVKDGAIAVDASPVSGTWDRQRLDQIVTNLLSNAVKYRTGTTDQRFARSRRRARSPVDYGPRDRHRRRPTATAIQAVRAWRAQSSLRRIRPWAVDYPRDRRGDGWQNFRGEQPRLRIDVCRRAAAPACLQQGSSMSTADQQRSKKQILIVEDDLGSRRALTNVLEDRGYRVAGVGSVAEAMHFLRQQAIPELIVLDLMLPDMEGWDFRHEQKKDPRLADIPVIAVSAVGKLVDVEYSFRKPLDYDQFLRAVEQYVPPTRAR